MCLSRIHVKTSGTRVILGALTRSLATAAGGLVGIAAAFGRPPGGGGGGGPEPLKPGMGGGGGGGGPGIVLYSDLVLHYFLDAETGESWSARELREVICYSSYMYIRVEYLMLLPHPQIMMYNNMTYIESWHEI